MKHIISSLKREADARAIIKVTVSVLALAFVLCFLSFFAACGNISDQIIRLHVIANSDSRDDQEIKLKVRDAVLNESAAWYQDAQSFEDANAAICLHLDAIQQAAEQVLKNEHAEASVRVEVKDQFFTTRDYENFSLPAGTYRTLRVVIGEGEGQNWWCMVYPALCIPAAQASEEDILAEIPKAERDIIENPEDYQIRFKVVELIESIREKLNK